MPFAIEMNLDAAADAAVRRIWGALKERALSAAWVEGARPHVSLGGAGSVEQGIEQRLETFAKEASPMSFQIRSVGTFPSGVLFLAPIVTKELLAIHAR